MEDFGSFRLLTFAHDHKYPGIMFASRLSQNADQEMMHNLRCRLINRKLKTSKTPSDAICKYNHHLGT